MKISKIKQLTRLLYMYYVLMRYIINRTVFKKNRFIFFLSYLNPFSFLKQEKNRERSIKVALEKLGPIFVKFGQALSTREDLFSKELVSELSMLQDRVSPFDSKDSIKIIENSLGKSIGEIFSEFKKTPLASASVAQVHSAVLHDRSNVIVKVLRPNIRRTICIDIKFLGFIAKLVELVWKETKRLCMAQLISEFELSLLDELDLMREASNASQLRRNFSNSNIMYVPKVYWEYTTSDVMVMEKISGISISDIEELKKRNVNMKKLAERGIAIFFTQVFRDCFFHADMHPGNLFVDVEDPENPRYLGVDFGIMGTLAEEDKYYLAENIVAFFYRDYHRISVLHVESGWVADSTRIDQFESAIRTVSEPIFERPLGEISFGKLLTRLFQTAKRFDMKIQPQLILLQKTLFNIEGLGRKICPDLNLWETAKPFIEDWIKDQKGVEKLKQGIIRDWQIILENSLRVPILINKTFNKYGEKKHELQENKGFNIFAYIKFTLALCFVDIFVHNFLFKTSIFL